MDALEEYLAEYPTLQRHRLSAETSRFKNAPRASDTGAMKRPTDAAPTEADFEAQVHSLTLEEAKSERVQWLIAECRRARDQEVALRQQLRALGRGRHL